MKPSDLLLAKTALAVGRENFNDLRTVLRAIAELAEPGVIQDLARMGAENADNAANDIDCADEAFATVIAEFELAEVGHE